jgi:hypothetical protein
MAIYTKHPIGFKIGGTGTESMASGIQTDRFAGGAYSLVIGP